MTPILKVEGRPAFSACVTCRPKSQSRLFATTGAYLAVPATDRVHKQQLAGLSLLSERFWQHLDWSKPSVSLPGTQFSVQPAFLKHVKKTDRVLHIGARNGHTLIELAKRGYTQLSGLEMNVSAVQQARQSALKELGDKLCPDFVYGNIQQLPFTANSQDCVIFQGTLSGFVREHTREGALKEAFRVLKPGGLLYVEEFGYFPRLQANKKRYEMAQKLGLPQGVIALEDPQTGAMHLSRHFTRDELLGEIKAAGFQHIAEQSELVLSTRTGKKNQGHQIIAMKMPEPAPTVPAFNDLNSALKAYRMSSKSDLMFY